MFDSWWKKILTTSCGQVIFAKQIFQNCVASGIGWSAFCSTGCAICIYVYMCVHFPLWDWFGSKLDLFAISRNIELQIVTLEVYKCAEVSTLSIQRLQIQRLQISRYRIAIVWSAVLHQQNNILHLLTHELILLSGQASSHTSWLKALLLVSLVNLEGCCRDVCAVPAQRSASSEG